MCRPASFVITRQGRGMLANWSKETSESHTDIIEKLGLREQNVRGEYLFVRIEITPPNDDFMAPLDQWQFKVDQDVLPEWWDADAAERCVRKELPEWLAAKVVLPGQIRAAVCAQDYVVLVMGEIQDVWGSAVIKNVRDSAVIQNVRDSATIQNVRDSATIQNVRDSAVIQNVGGSAVIKNVWDSAVIQNVRGSATIIVRNQKAPASINDYAVVILRDADQPPTVVMATQK